MAEDSPSGCKKSSFLIRDLLDNKSKADQDSDVNDDSNGRCQSYYFLLVHSLYETRIENNCVNLMTCM